MKKIILIALLAYGLSACVVVDTLTVRDWELQEQTNREEIARLQLGANLDDIVSTMGAPQFNEVRLHNDETVQVLFYRTNRVTDDGNTTKDECTPLLFINGKLKGWGHRVLLNASAVTVAETFFDAKTAFDKESSVNTEQGR